MALGKLDGKEGLVCALQLMPLGTWMDGRRLRGVTTALDAGWGLGGVHGWKPGAAAGRIRVIKGLEATGGT